MAHYIKSGLACLLLLLMLLPLAQFTVHFFEEDSLNGHFEKVERPELNKKSWLTGDFQNQYKTYFKEQVGFSNFLVRFHNQIHYDLFNQVNTKDVIVGKNNVLYDGRHINALQGKDFLGDELILKNVVQLRNVTDSLKANGKEILIVLAPNKARYFRDEVPVTNKIAGPTNYERYLNYFKQYNITYLDFNAWFLKQKTKQSINLIPKYGIHWSEYAATLVEDSIINYCNEHYGYQLPRYHISKLVTSKIPSKLDYDLGKSLNLFSKPTDEDYIYPEKELIIGQKKKLLAIGDSYFKMLYLTGFTKDIFDSDGLWYYNREVLKENLLEIKPPPLKEVLPKTDIVIIMLTEWNLYRLGFGIIEEIDSYYTGNQIESNEVRYFINRIRSDKAWLTGERKKAIERGISLDTMIVKAAKYMVRNKNN
jgi:hypothetical protein